MKKISIAKETYLILVAAFMGALMSLVINKTLSVEYPINLLFFAIAFVFIIILTEILIRRVKVREIQV